MWCFLKCQVGRWDEKWNMKPLSKTLVTTTMLLIQRMIWSNFKRELFSMFLWFVSDLLISMFTVICVSVALECLRNKEKHSWLNRKWVHYNVRRVKEFPIWKKPQDIMQRNNENIRLFIIIRIKTCKRNQI